MSRIALLVMLIGIGQAQAKAIHTDYLIKLAPQANIQQFSTFAVQGSKIQPLHIGNWIQIQIPQEKATAANLKLLASSPLVSYIQPNYPVHLLNDYKVRDPYKRSKLRELASHRPLEGGSPFPMPGGDDAPAQDNPAIPAPGTGGGSGSDPEFSKQWGMNDIGVKNAWSKTKGAPEIIVAVIDTGVDYTHEDLVQNIWRNPGETGTDAQGRDKSSNNIDDDSNGYVDDVVGWDFAANDNKPFDMTTPRMELLMGGGNPGHGTHCAGNVGARADNGKGVAGVAPNIRIMPIRFLNEKGQGDTAGAIKAIQYAVKNGARVLSNSWGSEGEEDDRSSNQALKDAIEFARQQDRLFVAAAGNGHNGVGYDNDSDPKPGYPASYSIDNIVSVAALDSHDQLGAFSNWGARTVHLGAPGVVVFSTVPGNKYEDKVIDIDFLDLHVTWDGTSMATPHVAGAAALYWSKYPNKTYKEVKEALLASTVKINALSGKTVSGGKLNVANLLN